MWPSQNLFRPREGGEVERMVRALQWGMAAGAVLFIGGIVTWIIHLIRTAWRLGDVPSASIGISLVAIPVFLTLLGVILYVFWGLLGSRGGPADSSPPGSAQRGGGDRRGEASRTRILIVLLGLVGCVSATDVRAAFGGHESLSVLLPADPLEGSRLFTEKGCPSCHAVHGAGGMRGPDLGRGTLNRPLLEIAGVMWNHSPGMEHVFQEKRIARPKFKPSEMASLLTFLYYLGSLDPPGDAAVGSRLFRQKGCETCHSLGGKGGSIGPALDKYSSYASPLYLTRSLWNHGRAMAKEMQKREVPRPTFEGSDIPDLLAYVRSAGSGERIYVHPGSPKRGEKLFTSKHCIECHSVRGHGGKVGPDLGIKLKGSLMRIAGSMWNHGPKMWAKMAERGISVPTLTTEEMSDLISYLYYFQFIDPPGDAGRGLAVFREKRCGTCHAPAATGKPVAPPLDEVVETFNAPVDVITGMWNHAGRMEGKMAEENVAWPVLRGGETSDLIAYLLSVRRGTSPADEKR
jgi:mono/diheme cytochrome c family protein